MECEAKTTVASSRPAVLRHEPITGPRWLPWASGRRHLQSLQHASITSVNVDPAYLSVRETAKRLGVHENTVRNWAKDGRLLHSRKPGSSFYRFDPKDVEKVSEQQRKAISVEPGRRTIGPELVDGSQLDQWANLREAQDRFPELVRRLLQSTAGVSAISVRAGDGVSAPGWDGSATSEGSEHLPAGKLYFELGVTSKVKAKADHDWVERCRDPRGAIPAESVFIFVTPRRWGGRDAWAAARRAEQYFMDVRVIDADDLEGWLQTSPVVHQWISEQLHRRPRDAQTLEAWWKRFQSRTNPTLPNSIFLAGRESERKALIESLSGAPNAITIKADWREDAIAFISAALSEQADPSFLTASLVVSSVDVWDRVATSNARMNLISLLSETDVAVANEHGHHVILPIGSEASTRGSVITLSRPDRARTRDAFADLGVDFDQADRLAGLARRSMPAMVRRISRDPVFAHPTWSRLPDAALLGPLVLLGAWIPSSPADKETVERAVTQQWNSIERTLLHLARIGDPPVIRSGDSWHFVSQEEAMMLLIPSVTAGDFLLWQQLALEVLTRPFQERARLPGSRLAVTTENSEQAESGALRQGIASTLAILGANGKELSIDGIPGDVHASRIAKGIFQAAEEDSEGLVWQGLADVMPLLAEASPRDFLDAIYEDLAQPSPLLAKLFKDQDAGGFLASASPHTALLFALELLCWSPDFFAEASTLLAKLSTIDPGGKLLNRPLSSLKSILVDWVSHTSASTAQKLECMDSICAELPSFGWRLLLELWPQHHSSSMTPAMPRFRDWKPVSNAARLNDRLVQIHHMVGLAIELAGESADRWAEICERLGTLPAEEFYRLLGHLKDVINSANLGGSSRVVLWEALRSEIERNEQFPNADWSLDESKRDKLRQLCSTLEPVGDVRRFGYLFSRRPHIPGVNTYDEASYSPLLLELQEKAILDVVHSSGAKGLMSLAESSKDPWVLGWVLGGMTIKEDLTSELLPHLDSEIQPHQRLVAAWTNRRLDDGGVVVLLEMLDAPEMAVPTRRSALALQLPADPEIWEELQRSDADMIASYWRSVNPWRISNRLETAIQQLCKHGRPWAAVELVGLRGMGEENQGRETVDIDVIERVFEQALISPAPQGDRSMLGYEVGQILDALEAAGRSPEKLAQFEYSLFYLLEDHRPPRALFTLLGDDPRHFVELARHVYMPKSGKARRPEDDQAMAHLAWSVMQAWHGMPGLRIDGTIDCHQLAKWVSDARLLFADADREDIGDELVGQVLSRSPVGVDGIWPAECVREILESIGSVNVETGLEAGAFNARGVTTRGVYDGGVLESKLSAQYREWAQKSTTRWPRTCRVLRRLADVYESFGRREDMRATERADSP